jgi:hypothetical protein
MDKTLEAGALAEAWRAVVRTFAAPAGHDGCGTVIVPSLEQQHIETAITAYLAALPATDTSGLVERLRDEAQMWKMEAMAHKSSLHEAYQACSGATGEPGNWNGAEPIKATIASLTDHIETLEREQAEAEAVIRPFAGAADYWAAFGDFQRITSLHQYGDCLEVMHLRAARSYLEGRK